jgi:Glycosyl hydrolases family 2, TIM barrel domain
MAVGVATLALTSSLLLVAIQPASSTSVAAAPTSSAAAPTYDNLYLDGVSGPTPTTQVDLAGTWDFLPQMNSSCAGVAAVEDLGPQICTNTMLAPSPTTISVPGGGWTDQGFPTLSEGLYSTQITIPAIGGPQADVIFFGGVGNQATMYVAGPDATPGTGQVVGTQDPGGVDASFDITRFVQPGGTYTLSVEVQGMTYFQDGLGDSYVSGPGATRFDAPVSSATGIFRSALLQVFPAVYISAASVITSVTDRSLRYNVSITNDTDHMMITTLGGKLTSWNQQSWRYPDLPRVRAVIPAGRTTTVQVGPIPWTLGSGSYWWPNVPYVAGYKAELHDLNLQLTTFGEKPAQAMYQFGFRQIDQVGDRYYLNDVPVDLRGTDEVHSGDTYDTNPGFGEPSATNPGWPGEVQNFLRLNYNVVRIHRFVATPYMLDVTDQMGLMVIDGSSVFGSGADMDFTAGLSNMESEVKAQVQRDLNHPSVVRWSEANEPDWSIPGLTNGNIGGGAPFQKDLYETIESVDQTRPVSTEAFINYDGQVLPQYTVICHYAPEILANGPLSAEGQYTDNTCQDNPGTVPGAPYGQGEFVWPNDTTAQGAMWFATAVAEMRLGGASDIRPYKTADWWPSLVSGVTTNGVVPATDPWSSPILQRVQDANSPLLVMDDAYWEANKLSDANGDWPAVTTYLGAGQQTTRILDVFNDTLSGNTVSVTWGLHQGSPTGAQVAGQTLNLHVPLGGHVSIPISFQTPNSPGTNVYLVLSSSKPGYSNPVFYDAGTVFAIGPAGPSGNVTCSGSYTQTTISGNVTVPSGSTCTLTDVMVDGNIQVHSGGSLLDNGSTINGNLQTNNAAWVVVDGGYVLANVRVQETAGAPPPGDSTTANDLCAAKVTGNVSVRDNGANAPFDIGAGPDCATPLSVGGNLQVQSNAGTLAIGPAGSGQGNSVQGNIQVTNNTGGGTLQDNSAGKNCQLGNDTPGIVGSGNSAVGNNRCNGTA